MDQAFKEEKAKLAQVEKRIDELAQPYMNTVHIEWIAYLKNL